eukprot:Rhum_TRINITY_DN14814_c18_g1::Rhum_TRINITY_DN14814_c18_g1_i1::g.121674::m.121674
MVVFQAEGDAVVALPVPEKLSWCAHNALYARFLMDVDVKGKAHKRAFCLTKGVCYVCQTNGGVDRAVQLRQIQGIRTQDCLVKGMLGSTKTEEHCILLSVQGEADWLLRLSHDKHNNDQSNDPLLLEQAIVELAARLQHTVAVTPVPEGQDITELADYTNPEGHMGTKEKLQQMITQVKDGESSPAAASPVPAASVGLEQPAAAAAAPVAPPVVDPVTRQPMAFSDNTHAELNEKIRSLEAELSVAKSKAGSAEQRATEMQRKASALQEQLDEEKAQRDDTVREMRADFDTKFIQKQAEEFELRQRQHQRLRDKDQCRIKELEEQLNVPKTYSGPADLQQRIRDLEKALAASELHRDTAEHSSIHYENSCDELVRDAKEIWRFLQEGALPRIRDLQAERPKDAKKLPLLPKIPSQLKPVAKFVYDPANKPVRAVAPAAAAAAPAAAAAGADLSLDLDDLDLGGGGAAPAPAAAASGGIDLDDDLDIDLGGPAGGGGGGGGGGDTIDLDDDLL